MFSILANYVLKDGGTVFGVELDENLNPHEMRQNGFRSGT